MKTTTTFTCAGSRQRPMLCDLRLPHNSPAPLLVFIHGFKGFKDWGHFNLVADALCAAGLAVLKFNFSHNGTTVEAPTDFADLEAFGRNTFSYELDDLGCVIDHVLNDPAYAGLLDASRVYLLGHSRGGGIAVLKAAEDARVKKLVTWAAVSDFEKRVNPPELERWKNEGVLYSLNTRTGQQMPQYYILREDFYEQQQRLDIGAAARRLKQSFLIIHGTNDESVPIAEAEQLAAWNPQAQLLRIENANHTFGGKHPFTESVLPAHTREAVEATLSFLAKE